MLLTRGLKFRPSEPLHVKTFDNMADEEVPTFFIEMVRGTEDKKRVAIELVKEERGGRVSSGYRKSSQSIFCTRDQSDMLSEPRRDASCRNGLGPISE